MKYMKLLLLLSSFSLLSCGFDLLNQHPDAKYEEQKGEKLPKDLKGGLACSADGKCPSGYDCVKAAYYPNGKCVKCENELMTGENCDQCKNGKNGPNCDSEITTKPSDRPQVCDNPHKTGENCEKCADGWIGKDCNIEITCLHGVVNSTTGHCEEGSCAKGWTGEDCNMCAAGFTGENCVSDQCNNHGTFNTQTGKCDCDTNWDGENCNKCKPGHGGTECNTHCVNPRMTGENCNECPDANMTGDKCDQPITCNVDHGELDTSTGKCSECKEGWSGDDCKECDHSLGYGAECKAYGSVADLDGNKYKTTIIGKLEWMAENIAATTGNDGSSLTCYANNNVSVFITTYGCLYTWEDAMKVCPSGWHLPLTAEFNALLDYVRPDSDSDSTMSRNLRASSWASGADKYGFGALPAGLYNDDYNDLGQQANFWSATDNDDDTFADGLYLRDENVAGFNTNKVIAFSVRCVRDATNH